MSFLSQLSRLIIVYKHFYFNNLEVVTLIRIKNFLKFLCIALGVTHPTKPIAIGKASVVAIKPRTAAKTDKPALSCEWS